MVKVYSPAGADLTVTSSTAKFALGTKAELEANGEAIYCLSSGSISQYALVAIDESFTARGCTTTLAGQAATPGWPQIALATDVYGWVQTKGADSAFLGKMKDNTAADAQLFTSASVGIMSSQGSTGTPLMLAGVRNVGLSSGAGAAYRIMAVNPHFVPKTTPA